MTVVGARIDNRLLHGIVATQWAPQSGANRVMVINDEIASDPIKKESMKLGRPSGMAVSIITEQTALTNFKAGKYESQKVFVIAKDPQIFLNLLKNGVKIPQLILGGTTVPEEKGALKVSNRAYISESDAAIYQEIIAKGTKVLAKFVPSDKDVNVAKLI